MNADDGRIVLALCKRRIVHRTAENIACTTIYVRLPRLLIEDNENPSKSLIKFFLAALSVIINALLLAS
jgi:hypothetical protein